MYIPSRLHVILQWYITKNSVILAQKQAYRPREQNTEPRHKPVYPWSIDLWQWKQEYTMKKWREDSLVSKYWLESWAATCKSMNTPFTIHTNKLKMVSSPIRHDIIKLLEENTGKTFFHKNPSNIFLDQSLNPKEIKERINKWGLVKYKSFLKAKETINKMRKTFCAMGGNMCYWQN